MNALAEVADEHAEDEDHNRGQKRGPALDIDGQDDLESYRHSRYANDLEDGEQLHLG